MEKIKWKKGDWCFCEFTLQQIMNVEENRVTEVSDGICRMSGHDISDRCFPLDMTIKRCSDGVEYWSKGFHKLNHRGLNYPDLNRELVRRWVDMCESAKDKKKLQERYDSLRNFGQGVLNKVSGLNNETIEGVKIYR